MKVALILSVLLIGAFCATTFEKNLLNDLFTQWKITHNKHYKAGHEEEHRFNIFVKNYIQIQKHNLLHKSVTLALNQFADLTSEEFSNLQTGLIPRPSNGKVFNPKITNLPSSIDWREKGAVTPVKNQGACGSCWAFSAVGALESLYFNKNGKLVSFAEQNFVDCVTKDYGCQGGWMDDAFEYSAANGIETADTYPYTARTGKCAYEADKAVRVNTGFTDVAGQKADALKAALNIGTVSVAIQADQTVFQFYRSGVIQNGCGDKLNHGVLAVGYGTFTGIDAFIVKNSWGLLWGNSGYVLIGTDESQNNGNGVCGILKASSYPN